MRFLDVSRVRTRLDCRYPATDGTALSIDLYLPPRPGLYPVLLHRTCADNNRAGRPGISKPPAERWKSLAARGFIVATGDVRGRGDSEGRFEPFVNERSDGGDTVDWLRSLDEADGRVGVFGSGYAAFCAWAAAVARPIDAVVSISPFGAIGTDLLHRRGAIRQDWLFWMHLVGGRSVQPADLPDWTGIYRHRPIADLAAKLGRDDIAWSEWVDHSGPEDPYWTPLQLDRQIQDLEAPVLHLGGWFDGAMAATKAYVEASSTNRAQDIIIGPWDSRAVRRPQSQVGGFDFGPRAVIDLDETVGDWFAAQFDPCSRPESALVQGGFKFDPCLPRHRLFVTGRNEWVETGASFKPCMQLDRLYLSSGNGANTRRGDGRLVSDRPGPGRDSLTHDADLPIRFQPAFRSFASVAMPSGLQLDQAHITCRDEALVYTGAAANLPTALIGLVEVRLWVETQAADADIFVLLSDAFPADTADLHLAHDAVRLGSLADFQPGSPLAVDFALGPIAHEIQPGHRLRLTIVPSLFPLYASNPQSGDYARARDSRSATIEIIFGGDRLSYIQPKPAPFPDA